MKNKAYKFKCDDKVRVVTGVTGTCNEYMGGWTGVIEDVEVRYAGWWDYLVHFDEDTLLKMRNEYITKCIEVGVCHDLRFFNEGDLELIESYDYKHTGGFVP